MMSNQAPYSFRTFLLSLVALVSSYVIMAGLTVRGGSNEQLNVRILQNTQKDSLKLRQFDFLRDVKTAQNYVEASVSEQQLAALRRSGLEVTVIPANKKNITIPRSYMELNDIESQIRDLQRRHPDLIAMEEIGESTSLKLPIWAVKVSDHAARREDEPRILFMGVHHAREPIGANICLDLIESLCTGYTADRRIRSWVNLMEIWFIPVVNPDGYKYVMDSDLSFPWWRKNLRDNDGDGIFNPLVDGVDLNRNYDFNWGEGGDGKPSSWFFRGRAPFSEKETKSILRLATRENFVIGVSYHSYGESILFPWGNYDRPPDLDLITDIAGKMASQMRKVSRNGTYSILPLNGRVGQSSIWMYGHLRVIDYIVEVGTEYFPADKDVDFILNEQRNGAYYLFDRMLETGVRGHVFDAATGQPLNAEIEVQERAASYVRPRRTDMDFGSFHRLLGPGTFHLHIQSEGYAPKVVRVNVRRGRFERIRVGLRRQTHTNGHVDGN